MSMPKMTSVRAAFLVLSMVVSVGNTNGPRSAKDCASSGLVFGTMYCANRSARDGSSASVCHSSALRLGGPKTTEARTNVRMRACVNIEFPHEFYNLPPLMDVLRRDN